MSSNVRASVSPAATCAAAPKRSFVNGILAPLRSVALLVFLPAAAVTGVVAANLRLVALHLRDRRIVAARSRRLRRAAHRRRRRRRSARERQRGRLALWLPDGGRWWRAVRTGNDRAQPPEIP